MNIATKGFDNLINLIQNNPTLYLLIFGLALVVTIAALVIKKEPLITMMFFTWILASARSINSRQLPGDGSRNSAA